MKLFLFRNPTDFTVGLGLRWSHDASGNCVRVLLIGIGAHTINLMWRV